jgi:molybdopterin converting factor small subunit
MEVTVRTVALIKTLLGRGEIDLSLPAGTTIDGLFTHLGEIGGERLAPYVAVPEQENGYLPLRVIVNGDDMGRLDGRRTVLKDGDEVLIFMPLAGG